MCRILPHLLLFSLLLGAGCKKEQLGELVDTVKQKATEGAEKAKQQFAQASQEAQEKLNLAGTMELQLDAPVKTSACYVEFVPSLGGRPAILQMRSYKSEAEETAPSVLVQAQVTGSSLQELVGKSFPAQVWVQSDAAGTIWSHAGSSVQLQILGLAEGFLTAQLQGGELRNAASAAVAPAAGTFNGMVASSS